MVLLWLIIGLVWRFSSRGRFASGDLPPSGVASASEQQGEQQEQQESEPGEEQGEQMDTSQAWSEEDAQAMEQWLRRIPDDPGGLLRRKFRNQHQRRGAPEDETESW